MLVSSGSKDEALLRIFPFSSGVLTLHSFDIAGRNYFLITLYVQSLTLLFCPIRDALDALGLKRYCCRRMLLSHVDLIEKLLNYAPLEK